MHRTLITLATYNEMENLPLLVEEIFRFAPDVDILVIDDNSPDGTGKWCDQAAARRTAAKRVCTAPANLGLGTAILTGMRHAIDQGYEWVLNMDADFSHHPRHLPALLACRDEPADGRGVDVMIGSRYVPGGRIEGWGLEAAFHESCRQHRGPSAAGTQNAGLQRLVPLLSHAAAGRSRFCRNPFARLFVSGGNPAALARIGGGDAGNADHICRPAAGPIEDS